MSDLKPCPFCGGEAKTHGSDTGPLIVGWFVECSRCGVSGPRCEAADSGVSAIEAWNRRAQPAPITSETGNQAAQGASAITSESAQAEHDCDCGRKWKHTTYGWASTEPAQAGALLTYEEIAAEIRKRGQLLNGVAGDRFIQGARWAEQAVRSKLGAGVPMTREDRYDAFTAAERAAGENISPWSFDQGVRAAERHHGIVGKEGA